LIYNDLYELALILQFYKQTVYRNTPMLVFILLTMMMGGVVLLSASLFYLNSGNAAGVKYRAETHQRVTGVIFDDVELPQLSTPNPAPNQGNKQTTELLDFTRTSRTKSDQLPLLGMPDKAFYHIH
jgi:hypothetical protein